MTHNDKRPIIYVSDRQAEIDRIRLEAKQAEWIPAREREMARANQIKLALQRAIIELEYAHSKLGNDRSLTRAIVIRDAKIALKQGACSTYKAA